MSMSSDFDDPGCCPFLVPVVADRLWMRPIGVYCRRPGAAGADSSRVDPGALLHRAVSPV